MTFPRLFCATCARRQWRGSYYRCPLRCGAVVCRKKPRCGNTHLPNCPVRQAEAVTTRSPQGAA